MPRSISDTDSAELLSQITGIVEFLEIDFPWGNVYLTNTGVNYTWGGNTYLANGAWQTLNNLAETTDGIPRASGIVISGLDATTVQNCIINNIGWIKIIYSLGLTDADHNLLDNPTFQSNLFLGTATIALTKGSGAISIVGESLLADLQNRTAGCLATMADQEERFAGDTIFYNISAIPNTLYFWGSLPITGIGVPPGTAPYKPYAGKINRVYS